MKTVYLTGKYAPGDKNWDQGTIHKRDNGVLVEGRFGVNFYPWDKIERIKEG